MTVSIIRIASLFGFGLIIIKEHGGTIIDKDDILKYHEDDTKILKIITDQILYMSNIKKLFNIEDDTILYDLHYLIMDWISNSIVKKIRLDQKNYVPRLVSEDKKNKQTLKYA